MVKPILQLYPMIPAKDEAEREAIRPAGRSAERYQGLVEGMGELVRAADRLGFWGVSSIEHHFHSEGYEVGPNPGLLNANWAAITERVNIGQLGFTMSAQNPFRVAEDTAIIDHLTGGRSFVGFSRGYQARWTNVLGQHLGVRATLSPEGMTDEQRAGLGDQLSAEKENDRRNREVFEEHLDMVVDAWTQDSVEFNTPTWQVPNPYDAGIDWKMREVTARLGAPGEIGPDGMLRRVSVTPAPYTKPHPPVFVASAASLETVEYCGTRGFIPAYFSGTGRAGQFGRVYAERAQAAGFPFAVGQNQALVRWMQIGETNAAARRAVADYDVEIYKNLYRPLTPVMPYDEADPVQSVLDSGLWMCGTADEVRDQFVAQWEELPAEYVVLIFHYAQEPTESVIRNMELFMEHVKPALDELTAYNAVAA
jgi:alkanesulfonate monooxygenase SsuD/methylene tetrahydromethanopterin reductase-like flavin-dependent oxidoreductase (luciferase family)